MHHRDRMAAIHDDDAFDALSDAVLRAILDDFSASHGLPALTRPKRGSAIVGLGDGEVVKIMAPHDAAMLQTELACLSALDGKLPTPTPRVLDHGTWLGWPYLRMSRLEGEELTEAWDSLTPADHRSLATQLGETLAVLHGLEAPAEVPRVDWAAWCQERGTTVAQRQRSRGCSPELADALQRFMDGVDLSAGRAGWLHTEVMREHLLVTRASDGVRLSGLFDFEPSWVAPVDYEMSSVGLFFSAGDGELFGLVQRAVGVEISPERTMAMVLLHRYSNVAWYRRRLGGPEDPAALAAQWFAA